MTAAVMFSGHWLQGVPTIRMSAFRRQPSDAAGFAAAAHDCRAPPPLRVFRNLLLKVSQVHQLFLGVVSVCTRNGLSNLIPVYWFRCMAHTMITCQKQSNLMPRDTLCGQRDVNFFSDRFFRPFLILRVRPLPPWTSGPLCG